MASPTSDGDATSMFMARREKAGSPDLERVAEANKMKTLPEIITVKDFFDFMKTAYQVYEHLDGDDECNKIDWEELTKLTVINHVIEQEERDLLQLTAYAEQKPVTSKSDMSLEKRNDTKHIIEARYYSCSEIQGEGGRKRGDDARVEMLGAWTEANLNCKLNDVINEGLLDSILPYLVGYKKPTKTTSVYTPVVKKPSANATDVKKPASFGSFVCENDSTDRLGRRKSAVIAAQEKANQKQDGDVEIHVCDEVKGLKKDFRCPQKLLVSKMGYFADVTSGQRLEDMDISVHCDIQIFDWLMRWVKRDSILVADWPLLDPHNVVPILVSASFLQMEPLLHDCLIFCHAHMSDIVKTTTNLACLNDTLLNRLSAMYTNAELEGIRDRKDKIQSRLYCKMILSLAEPVPETLRGHYATLATLFKCSKCNKLLGRNIAEQVPCQPASMRIDRRGNVISSHTKEPAWTLNEYITWLYGELRSWRRVYWRLWADCHFLRCQLCDSYFPAYQMEWCSHHEQSAHMFAVDNRPALPAGRYPCCGERAYRFETLSRNTGCQFREHMPDEALPADAAVMALCTQFREMIAMRPPQLKYPERLTRLVAREQGEDNEGRLSCKEVFWWTGVQLVPARSPLGLLGKLYTSDSKFNPSARPGSPALAAPSSTASLTPKGSTPAIAPAPVKKEKAKVKDDAPGKKGASGGGDSPGCEQSSDSEDSEQSSASARSDEDAPRRREARGTPVPPSRISRCRGVTGRQWVSSLSARSNQDGQRRFEERAGRQMRAALARRNSVAPGKPKAPPGGVYARLEAEWRERYGGQQRTRNSLSARPRVQSKFK